MGWLVYCPSDLGNCPVSVETLWCESEERAIAAWNTRTDPTRQALVDALKKGSWRAVSEEIETFGNPALERARTEKQMKVDHISRAAGLRAFADFIETHPEIEFTDFKVQNFGAIYQTAVDVLACDPTATISPTTSDAIAYVNQRFGNVLVQHVVRKEKIMEPAIVNGKVVWTLRKEFVKEEALTSSGE
jgi:hypothetical protein